MAKNELLPFANGEDANVLPTQQWEALTDILENGFQSGIAKSEQVNRVLAQGAVASYVLGQLIVDQLNKDATLDKDTLYQNLVSALQENAKDACLPLAGGTMTGDVNFPVGSVLSSSSEMLFSGAPSRATAVSYPGLALRNGNHSDPYSFAIAARSPTQASCLNLTPNGWLNLDGHTVLHSGNTAEYVVERGGSGNNWYRKWSSGIVEQVMAVLVPASGVATEFDLLVPMQGYWNIVATIDRQGDEVDATMSVYAGRNDTNSKLVMTIDRYPRPNQYSFYVFVYISGQGA